MPETYPTGWLVRRPAILAPPLVTGSPELAARAADVGLEVRDLADVWEDDPVVVRLADRTGGRVLTDRRGLAQLARDVGLPLEYRTLAGGWRPWVAL